MAEIQSFTGYEPNNDHKLFTKDKHPSEQQNLAEHEDLRVKPLFFHQPSMASTCDSEESIATPPPDSDLDDDQIRALLASSLYLQEREANAERLQVYHSVRENLMSSSSQDPLSTERPGALCKYSQLHMRYIQSPTHPSTHVQRERTERKTSRLQSTTTTTPRRVGSFASGSSWTLGHTGGSRQDTHGTPVPLWRKAVGGPT